MKFHNALKKTSLSLSVGLLFGCLYTPNSFAGSSCLELIYKTQFSWLSEQAIKLDDSLPESGQEFTPEQMQAVIALEAKFKAFSQEVQGNLGHEKLIEILTDEVPPFSSDEEVTDPFSGDDNIGGIDNPGQIPDWDPTIVVDPATGQPWDGTTPFLPGYADGQGKINDDPWGGEPLPGNDDNPWIGEPGPIDPTLPPPTDDWGFGWTKDPFNQYIKTPLSGEKDALLEEVREQTLDAISAKDKELASSLEKKLSQLSLKAQVEIMRLTVGISSKRASEILSNKTLVSIDLLLETKEKSEELAKEEIRRSAIRSLVEYLNEAHGSLAEFPAFDGDVVTRVEYVLSVYAPRLSLSHVYLQSLLRGVEKTSGSANYSLKETEVRYLDERGVLRKLAWKVRPY